MNEKHMKSVMTADFSDINEPFADGLPDSMNVYDELISTSDIDEELKKTHVIYGFCVFLAEEFLFQSKKLTAELESWSGEKWRKCKTSTKRKYTDNDAKRKIESSKHYMNTKILIAKYEKLHKQLAFGGGKALDMKAYGLKTRVNMIMRSSEDFNIKEKREELEKKVGDKIKNRL